MSRPTIRNISTGRQSGVAPAAHGAARLTHVDNMQPGFTRSANGDDFAYFGIDGHPITSARILDRIRGLAIPPAYVDVWICPRSNGHIQATARDARGRKQYRYHPEWNEKQARAKFSRTIAFAAALPAIRARVDHDLGLSGITHDRILATVLRLLELTLIRVGNDEYARKNQSFGMTTLENRHIRRDGTTITFSFAGKSGVRHSSSIRNRQLSTTIRQLHELPGQRLFRYRESDGSLCAVTSGDVNAYLQRISGKRFTAKDFRTFGATCAAAVWLAGAPRPVSVAAAKHDVRDCLQHVAKLLGNSVAVCRKAYVDPAVIAAYLDGTIAPSLAEIDDPDHSAAMLRFLRRIRRKAAA
jgi:DNA topoisomerase-1